MFFGLNDVAFLAAVSAPAQVVTDPDANAYILAVEAADGQALETAVRAAINDFVVGCKADGIWPAIKASCILAGARTLTGALVPLVGAAPTNVNFVSGDYNRKTGLVGDGSTKYLNSNRNNNADPQDSNHNAVYVSTFDGTAITIMGAAEPFNESGANSIGLTIDGFVFARNRTETAFLSTVPTSGLLGTSRSSSASYVFRHSSSSNTVSQVSQTASNRNVLIFGRATTPLAPSRLTFHSIGESLDLALLDARVTALINAFDAAI
jgi:hypothetical protein